MATHCAMEAATPRMRQSASTTCCASAPVPNEIRPAEKARAKARTASTWSLGTPIARRSACASTSRVGKEMRQSVGERTGSTQHPHDLPG